MATYSLGINAAVSATATTSGTPTTVYTSPANSYSIVNLNYSSVGTGNTISIGGQTFLVYGIVTSAVISGVIVGPGQSIILTGGGAAMTVNVSGVSFI